MSRVLERLEHLEAPAGLDDCLGGGGRVLSLSRAWPRSRDHLLLEYRTDAGQLVAAQWFGRHGASDRRRAESIARRTARASAAGDVALSSLTAPGAGQHEPTVVLQTGGADRRLSGLAGVLAEPGATLVSHRPERRAVVRWPRTGALTPPGSSPEDRYVKVVRPERTVRLMAAADLVGDAGAFETPRLVASSPATGVMVWTALRGRSLYDLLDSEALIPAAKAAGRALRALHTSGVAGGLPAHTASHERDVVATWYTRLDAFDPAFAARLRPALATAGDHLAALPHAPSAPVHRDCYDKQVFVTDGGDVGLLDFDTLACGDPALDLANVLVHLELRVLQGRCDLERATSAAAGLTAGYEPDNATRSGIGAYASATRARLACVYRFRPRWLDVAAQLVDNLAGLPLGLAA